MWLEDRDELFLYPWLGFGRLCGLVLFLGRGAIGSSLFPSLEVEEAGHRLIGAATAG